MNSKHLLNSLIEYRKQLWLNHCNYSLDQILLPFMRNKNLNVKKENIGRSAVIIDNRINSQWIFTILNTILMCPKDLQICIITDSLNIEKAKYLLKKYQIILDPIWININDFNKNIDLASPNSLNIFMKDKLFWERLPEEKILITQTDSLLSEPLPEFYFNFPYLGAPFIPRQQSEYFYTRNIGKSIESFIKIDNIIHGSPNPDVYPHLYGNGGLSIRSRSLMSQISSEQGYKSPLEEQEDVFFSRHIKTYSETMPLQIAQSFACESYYQYSSIGSHSAWKYFNSSQLAEHLEKHWKELSAIINPEKKS